MRAPDPRVDPGGDPRLPEAERDAARADLCRFLAACFYEPGPEWAEEALFDSMAAAAARIDGELAAIALRLKAGFEATPLQELQVDHTRLLLGAPRALAQPYASAWLAGEDALMQDVATQVQALYAEGGFEIAEDFRDLPDHVAAELEFLYLLIHRENEARWSGHHEQQAAVGGLKSRLLEGHLGRWLGPFLLALHEGAKTPFFEALAELTERFVRLEARRPSAPATQH